MRELKDFRLEALPDDGMTFVVCWAHLIRILSKACNHLSPQKIIPWLLEIVKATCPEQLASSGGMHNLGCYIAVEIMRIAQHKRSQSGVATLAVLN